MSSAPHLTYRPSVKRSRTHTTPAKPMTRSRTLSRLAKSSIGRISRFLNTGGGGGGGTGSTVGSGGGSTSRSGAPLPPLPSIVHAAPLPPLYKADGFENPTLLSDHGSGGGAVIARQRTLKGSISYPVLRSATCESVYECDSEDSRRLGFSTPRSSPAVGTGLRAYGEEEHEVLGGLGMMVDENELVITLSSRKDGGRPKLSRSANSSSPTPPPLPAKSVHWPPRKSSLATEYEYDPNECSPRMKTRPLPQSSSDLSEKEQRRVSLSAAMVRAQQRHATFHERDLETWRSFINDSFGSFEPSLTLATFDMSVPVLTIVDSEDDPRSSIGGARSPNVTDGFSPLTTNGGATSSSPRPLSTTSSLFTSALQSGRISAMLDSTTMFARPSSFSLSPKGMGDPSAFPFDVATSTLDESWLFNENRLSFLSYPFKIEGEMSGPEECSEDQDSITSDWHEGSGPEGAAVKGKKKQKTTISMMLHWCQNPPPEGYLVDIREFEDCAESHRDAEGEEGEEKEDERLFDLDELSDCFDNEIEVEMGATSSGARQQNRPVSLDAYPFRRMRGDDWSGLDRKIRNTM